MISLYDIKTLMNPYRGEEPADNFRIIDSWAEYDEKSSKDISHRKLIYLCYELEKVNPGTGERIRYYKAVKFITIKRLPEEAKQSTSLMDMQEQVLSAVHMENINIITVVANIIKPKPLGLLFLYGVQGISKSLEEAKQIAETDFHALKATLQGTFRLLQMRVCYAAESEWLREKIYGMDYLTMVRGIPKANKAGENGGNRGIGGKNVNPDSQGTLEEFITGMAAYEFVLEVISTPAHIDDLRGWHRSIREKMTTWNSQLQGTKSLSMNLSIPMMYAANASQSQGWNKGYTDASSVNYSTGESFGISQGQSVGQSLSQSFGQSVGQSSGTSISNSYSHGISSSQGYSFGESMGHSMGVSHSVSEGSSFGQNIGYSQNQGMSQGISANHGVSSNQGVSQNSGFSQGSNSSLSHGVSNGNSYSFGNSRNASTSHSLGTSQNVGFSQNNSVSRGNSASISDSASSSFSRSLSESSSNSASHSRSSSESFGGSFSSGESHGSNVGDSYGTNISINTGNGASQNIGWSRGGSASISIPQIATVSGNGGSNNGISISVSDGSSSGSSSGRSAGDSISTNSSSGHSWSGSTGMSDSSSYSHGLSESMSSGSSMSHGITRGASLSESESIGTSQGYGSSESYGQTIGNGVSESWAANSSTNDSMSYGQSASISNSTGISQSMGQSDSLGQSLGISSGAGRSYGLSTGSNYSESLGETYGTSYGQNRSMSQSVSESESLGQSYGQTYGQSYGQSVSTGYGQNVGQSESVSNGQSYSVSNGTSRSSSMGTSGTSTLGTSSSMGLGPSIGYSKSYQWLDQGVKDLLEILDYQNERAKKSLREGAFYTYVYIACPSLNALASAKALAKSTWQNEYALSQPLQVMDLTETEQKHLLYHFMAFSSDPVMEDVRGELKYKYSTMLLPEEFTAYTHLPRVSMGGIDAITQDIPKFKVPSLMEGEIYMGTILNTEVYDFENGYKTPYDYRIDESQLMHGYFTGASRSGKTVAAMRFIAELANIKRKKTKKRFRIVVMDPKNDWRTLARFVDSDRFRFYSMGDPNFRAVKINPFKIPYGVWPQKWIDGLIDIYCRAYGLLERGKQMLGSVIFSLYDEAGVFNACDNENWREKVPELSAKVCFRDVYRRFELERANLSNPTKGAKAGNDTMDAYNRLIERLSCFSRDYSIENVLYGTTEGIGIDELIGKDDVTVLESKGLESTFKNFIFGIITSGFYKYALANGGFNSDDQYETVLVIEEANEVLIGNDTAGGSDMHLSGESEFEQIIDQAAGYGLFIIAITQKIADMPSSVIANSGLVFAGRLGRDEDSNVVMNAIGKDPRIDDRDLKKYLPNAPTGYFVCKTGRNFDFLSSQPVLVQIAPLNILSIRNDELDALLDEAEVKKSLKELNNEE